MAKRFRSDPDAGAADKKRARAKADRSFKKNGDAPKAKEPRVLPDLLAADNGPKAKDFLHHYRTAKGFKAKLDEINGQYRNALKQAKEAGVDPAVITATMRYEKKDPLEVQTYFKQLRSMFEAAGIEVQLDFFEGSVSRPAQIYDEGFKAGKAAKSMDTNPHEISTDQGQLWQQGWNAGQAENMSGIGQTPVEEVKPEATAH